MAGALCPSGRCRDGTLLLGIVNGSGRLTYLDPPIPVDAAFVARAALQPRPPEARFRFAEPCIENDCGNWGEGGCSVAGRARDWPVSSVEDDALPPCHIRARCRWFLQEGKDICARCSLVVRSDPQGGRP